MNLLQLVNQLRVECGVSGPALTTVQGLGATTENARLLSWIQSAWTIIQTSKPDWQFMRESVTFQTVSQQWQYTPTEAGIGTTFANWKRDSFRCSSVGQNYADEQLINYMDWSTYRNLYQYGNMRTTYARPVVVSVMPNKDLAFGSVPDQAYVIDGEYYTKPITLTADADEPAMPERFHMAIVYRAMMYYGGYEAAPEVLARGTGEYKTEYSRLLIDQLPTVVSGPTLA